MKRLPRVASLRLFLYTALFLSAAIMLVRSQGAATRTDVSSPRPTVTETIEGTRPAPDSPQILANISGAYTVGAGATFTTLKSFFDAVNAGVVTGNITVNVTGNSTETATASLNQWTEEPAGSNFTMLIQPVGARTITGSIAGAVIKLNGADRVTIDGLNSGGNSLAVTNNSAANRSTAVWLASLGAGQGATNNTIRNLNITGGSIGTNSVWTFGVIVGGTTIDVNTFGADNDNTTIQGNTITKVQHGIYVEGDNEFLQPVVSAGGDDGLSITNNTIGPASAGANNIGATGIYVQDAIAPNISGNTVRNVISPNVFTFQGWPAGISLLNATSGVIARNSVTNVSRPGTTNAMWVTGILSEVNAVDTRITGNTVSTVTATAANTSGNIVSAYGVITGGSGAQVIGNTVTTVTSASTTGCPARGVWVTNNDNVVNVTLANNSVSDIASFSNSDTRFQWQPVGVYIDPFMQGLKLYHNSVNLFGAHAGANAPTIQAAVFVDGGGFESGIDFRDNVFVNTYNNSTSSSDKSYAFYTNAPASAFTNINYNDYYTSGAPGVLGFLGSDQTTIAAWRAATGQDLQSFAADPLFTSTTNLHVTSGSSPVSNTGTPIAAVTTDIDGDPRNATTPDVGADEFSVAVAAETDASVSGGVLTVVDGGTASDDALKLSLVGANVRVNDPNNTVGAGAGATQVDANTVDVPLASITSIQVNTLGGNDTLTLDLANGDFIPAGGLAYAGGSQVSTPGDRLVIKGGLQGLVTYNYTNAHDGSVVMSNFGTVSYTGLEPITNSGGATDIVFNLPTGPNVATLADDGAGGNAMSRLSGATFETTDFANPTGSLTVNRGDASDTLVVNSLPDFDASLTIGSGANPFGVIFLNGALTLAANKNLSVDASGNISCQPIAIIKAFGAGAITLNTARNITTINGCSFSVVDGNLTFNANTAGTTTGDFSGINLDGAFTTSGTGDLVFNGKGGAGTASGAPRLGIFVLNGGTTTSITSTSSAANAGTITLNGTGGQGASSNFGVLMGGAGTSISSVNGDINITGHGGNSTGIGNVGVQVEVGGVVSSTGAAKVTIDGTGGQGTQFNIGVEVLGASASVTSVTGDISITGHGGMGTGSSNFGVQAEGGGAVSSTGAAKININGTGGTSAVANSRGIGVRIANDTSQVTSSGGDITITGQGANGGSNNTGVSLAFGGSVNATGGAKININGTAGTGTSFLSGVIISNFDSATNAPSRVTSDSGDININGTAGNGTSFGNIGVNIDSSARIVATGAANITINGAGGNGTSDCYGVGFEGGNRAGTAVSAVNGAINISGTGGATAGTDMDGVRFEDSAGAQAVSVITTGAGALTINGTAGNDDPTSAGINIVDDTTMSLTGATNTFIADTMDFGDSNTSVGAGANALVLRQKSNGKTIDLGGADSATQLGLTDAELDIVDAGALNVGDSNSGHVNVSANITRAAATILNLTSGAAIDIATGSLNSAGGSVTLTPNTNVFPSNSGVDIDSGAGTLALTGNKDLKVVINGTTVDTGYTQLKVAGLVNLNNANLSFAGSAHTPSVGESFVVVNNDGADAITGAFNGLPEGASIPNFLGSGLNAKISYVGGDGNDAVLTVVSPVALTISIDNVTVGEGDDDAVFTVTQSAVSGSNTTFTYSTADGSATAVADYTGATNAPGMIAAGSTTTTISIPIQQDGVHEGDETFNVTLDNSVNAAIADGVGVGTITDDDPDTIGGAKTVCASGCDYTSLTGAAPGGLFAAINNAVVTGDLTVNIAGDLNEDGANALDQWTETGAGGYTLTIRPDGGTMRTISGDVAGGMIRLNGADRVRVDGRFNGAGRFLTFRNNSTGGATITLVNDASDNIIRGSVIEGSETAANSGVIYFGAGAMTGNDDNVVNDNQIRDRSDAEGLPANLFYSQGASPAVANSGNTISDNELFNFSGVGVAISEGNESWTISGNTIHQTASRATALTGIRINGGGANTVTRNTIHDLNTSGSAEGISVGGGDTTVSRNRIHSFMSAAGSNGQLTGIAFDGAGGASATLVNNQITLIPSFTNDQTVRGIVDEGGSGGALNVYSNSVLIGGAASGSSQSWATLRGAASASTHAARDNIFFNNRTGGAGNHFAAGDQSADGAFSSDYNLFVGTGSASADAFFDYGASSSGTPVSFAQWQSATGGDAHSSAGAPGGNFSTALFLDPTVGDLHINSGADFGTLALVSNAGAPVVGVTTDYDDETRDAATPDIGSDEIDAPSALFSMNMTVDRNPALVGYNHNYLISITNNGNAAATSMTLTDPLPSQVRFTAVTTSQGTCSYDSMTHTVNCNLGTLGVGSTVNIQLTTKTLQTGTLNNTATVNASQWDPATGGNTASVNGLQAIAQVDLSVSKVDSADPVYVSQNVTYTMVVKNYNTPISATGVVLTDSLPASMRFVSATTTQGSLITPPVNSSGIVTANIGTLAVNATATVTVTVRATTAGSITNTASATANENESNPSNNMASQVTTVLTAALQKVLLAKQVLTGGCENTTGQVYLTGSAPTGGLTVNLASDISGASVPASVFIPAGTAVSPAFNVTTSTVGAKQVGLITATLGASSVSRGLTINVGSGPCPP